MSNAEDPRVPFVRTLMPVWLVTAVWDFICATGLHVFAYHGTPARLWQGVAFTVLGPRALVGGATAVAAGLILHLAVALVWSALLVGALRAWPALRRAIRNPGGAFMVAVAYGPLIWLVMSLVVIPLATGQPAKFGHRWWVQLGVHVPFVALPLVFTARRVLRNR
ncbi:hypothetical protein [Longimicrobium sp.]|jgi:hypothetical protein|uniref:hypothetical protein n=1 Tax=Longimicrobium sp. TaxID=2029185 RepID=UPI002EDB2625